LIPLIQRWDRKQAIVHILIHLVDIPTFYPKI